MTFATDDFRPRFATGFLMTKEKGGPRPPFFVHVSRYQFR